MEQYISKSALMAEIEKRRDSFYSLSKSCEKGTPAKAGFYAQAQTLEGILSFLNSLEVKEVDLEKHLKEEPVSEDLEEAAKKYMRTENPPIWGLYYGFKAGAKWQKQQDKETIELAEDHAMLAGMEKMKQH